MKLLIRDFAKRTLAVSVVDGGLNIWSPSAKNFQPAPSDELVATIRGTSPNHQSLSIVELGDVASAGDLSQMALCVHAAAGGEPLADPLPLSFLTGSQRSATLAPGLSATLVPPPSTS